MDLEIISAACPVWAEIQTHIQRTLERISKKPMKHFDNSVFMLWPRLRNELGRWEDLDVEYRKIVAHAIFSMSSISMSDWFVRQAIEICPGLNLEFGKLIKNFNGENSESIRLYWKPIFGFF
jgi:hypothetical protein